MRVARILIATTAFVAGVSLIIATPAGAHTTKPPPTPPLPGALAIEAGRGGTLYATTGIFGPPSVVKINTHEGWRR